MNKLLDAISQVKRPHLGNDVPLIVFRAFRLFTGMYMADIVGEKGTVNLLQNAGRAFGREVGILLKDEKVDRYLERVASYVEENKVGLVIPVEVCDERIVLQLDECITCSGMPNIGQRICHFEVGFVAGAVEVLSGKRLRAYESKCNAMGEGVCEVVVELNHA